MFLETLKLTFGHNLIMGNGVNLSLSRVGEKTLKDAEKLDIMGLGLFDTAQPNYTTYYPEVKAEDLTPKDSEFIEPIFRALSEVIVHKKYNPVDFSLPGVLKASINLLKGQSVNADHETAIGNAMGSVSEVDWQDSYKSNGVVVPAGMNAKLRIDGKSNPRIARGIMMDPPSIHSTSVTVQFIWEKSHPSLSDQDFFGSLAKYEKDGQLVRRMANKVVNYHEISLVAHGADPFAQRIGDEGKINNPKYANTVYNAERVKLRKEQKHFFFDFKQDVIANEDNTTIPEELNDNEINSNNMEQLILALTAALGLTGVTTQEQLIAKIAEMNGTLTAANTNAATLQAEIDRLKPFESELSALKTTNTELQSFKDGAIKAARDRVNNLYNKITDNKPVAAILTVHESATLESLTALEADYSTKLDEKFPTKCGDCGSTNVSRASTKANASDDGPVIQSKEQVMEKLAKRKRTNAFQMHDAPTPAK